MDEQNKLGTNKFKQFIKNNFLYFIIGFAALAYIAFGLVRIEASGRTILEIIGQGVVIFLFGYLICRLFSMQGLLSGDRKEEVIKTNKLHSKCVADIDCKINEMDDWCDEENIKTLKNIRQQILNKEGLKYDDCFDKEGIAKEVTFPLKEYRFDIKDEDGKVTRTLNRKEMKEFNIDRYKVEKRKISVFNKRQKAKEKAFLKAIRVKITLLSTDAITATTIKAEDPHNFGMDRRQYQKKEARSDLISKAIFGIVFAYFTFSFIFGWAYLLSAIAQVALMLLFGGIKWVQSYYFVIEDLRKRTVKQINYLQRFKCDKGLATAEETKKEIESIGGDKYVSLGQMEGKTAESDNKS